MQERPEQITGSSAERSIPATVAIPTRLDGPDLYGAEVSVILPSLTGVEATLFLRALSR